ncbi:MAG: acyltransferase domain-containing protein [Deltaproteobacteria bacterium]|nr:acyltransferase domain-containing protein [Deltaproteobacteria bacterium]
MKKTVFIFSGEGTHDKDTPFRLLKHSPSWTKVEHILHSKLNLDLEQLWNSEIGRHRCPSSPLLTVISQICLSEIWCKWGYAPDVVIGHSTGELSAAYQAGLYSLEDILVLAYRIGEVASRLDGVMLHGRLSDSEIGQLPVNLSSLNFEDEAGKHVTVSAFAGEMEAFLENYPDFIIMKLPHPWHHPDYGRFSEQLAYAKSGRVDDGTFVSGVTTGFETRLDDRHWHQWLVKPIDFIRSMRTIEERYRDHHLDIIEIGFHPVLENCCKPFRNYTYVSSMFRGEDDIEWIMYQRSKLEQGVFLKKLKQSIDPFRPRLNFGMSLAYQGFDSLAFAELSDLLRPFFPSLAPQDFYRYKTINQLIGQFGIKASVERQDYRTVQRNGVVISGMSCRFPSSVETVTQFWETLVSGVDQVNLEATRGGSEAGFLNHAITRFDHQYFNISVAEARTMDPQQILALELAEMLWRDAGIDPDALDKKRVGVYIGAWNQEYRGDRTSVYYPTGVNPSIIAARISYHYDLRGPSWVSNTACSSSLLAVHYAAKDIEAGRVDYAIAGGINMLLDEEFTITMRKSGFLSGDNRCKSFDDSANGYVRAEGGGLVLLVNKSLAAEYYAELTGSAINQNGGRSQVITAPHPEAQEELIMAACQDAGIAPQEIAYIETHGTGTKIGDPIEMAAIQNTIAKDRTDTCYIGSVKSNIGHLESAAGIAGLLKSVAVLNHGIIPPNLHFQRPNQYIDFQSHPIQVVTQETRIDHQANIGVSSFGFGGSNAHIIVKGAQASVRKEIRPMEIPFDRQRAALLSAYLHVQEPKPFESPNEPTVKQTGSDVRRIIQTLFTHVTGVSEIHPDIELLEQGLDSISATEMIHRLGEEFNIEIEPDVLFDNPLFDQFAEAIEGRIAQQKENGAATVVTREKIDKLVTELFFQLTSIEEIDPEI